MENQNKDLKYYRENAEENFITTPISVLRYISELEKHIDNITNNNIETILPVSSIPEFGSKEWITACENMFGGNPKNSI
jgi:hypothetical protein